MNEHHSAWDLLTEHPDAWYFALILVGIFGLIAIYVRIENSEIERIAREPERDPAEGEYSFYPRIREDDCPVYPEMHKHTDQHSIHL